MARLSILQPSDRAARWQSCTLPLSLIWRLSTACKHLNRDAGPCVRHRLQSVLTEASVWWSDRQSAREMRLSEVKRFLLHRGPGAGAAVTAAGVFGDLIQLARCLGPPAPTSSMADHSAQLGRVG